jgi:hypothetical protein
MPDRTFGEPDDDAIRRRDQLVAELSRLPRQSPELRRFTAAVADIAGPSQLRLIFAWLERQSRSTRSRRRRPAVKCRPRERPSGVAQAPWPGRLGRRPNAKPVRRSGAAALTAHRPGCGER